MKVFKIQIVLKKYKIQIQGKYLKQYFKYLVFKILPSTDYTLIQI